MFNLIVDILMDIHEMVNRKLSKTASTDQCHLNVSFSSIQLIEVTCFFVQVIRWLTVGFN